MYISESGICPVTDQGLTLAKQARLEKLKTGNISVVCPKCKENPKISSTPNSERTIISCSCGFIRNIEINL